SRSSSRSVSNVPVHDGCSDCAGDGQKDRQEPDADKTVEDQEADDADDFGKDKASKEPDDQGSHRDGKRSHSRSSWYVVVRASISSRGASPAFQRQAGYPLPDPVRQPPCFGTE